MKYLKIFLVLLTMGFVNNCGIRSIPMAKNNVEAALSEITNQYKRRADLVPNLVNTVKGYATHEKETLNAVVEARSKASQTNIDMGSLNAESLKKFQAAQGELSSMLSRLLVVVERYPDLKANQNFRDLQAQLEGTENRITIARRRYIQSVQGYNNKITVPPESFINVIFYKYEKLPQWTTEDAEELKKAPKVEF
ncbi:MAG: LemA family protein [Deltaproteobacteria bacterium]|nr:LemA family protein [Deltaproteobacteria bacterium]